MPGRKSHLLLFKIACVIIPGTLFFFPANLSAWDDGYGFLGLENGLRLPNETDRDRAMNGAGACVVYCAFDLGFSYLGADELDDVTPELFLNYRRKERSGGAAGSEQGWEPGLRFPFNFWEPNPFSAWFRTGVSLQYWSRSLAGGTISRGSRLGISFGVGVYLALDRDHLYLKSGLEWDHHMNFGIGSDLADPFYGGRFFFGLLYR